jgi:hypothetical protein
VNLGGIDQGHDVVRVGLDCAFESVEGLSERTALAGDASGKGQHFRVALVVLERVLADAFRTVHIPFFQQSEGLIDQIDDIMIAGVFVRTHGHLFPAAEVG